MIGRLHHVILDCPDPEELARFYSALLGMPITFSSPGWVVVSRNDTTSGLAFQRVADYRAPDWPDPAKPQQIHFDVMVDDLEDAERAVVSLGARRLVGGKNVFADPIGHPFCLIPRPGWAPPVNP
jgi:catechol 2,3-dioxygenase-like lactoylglutathione lyase family enzyme